MVSPLPEEAVLSVSEAAEEEEELPEVEPAAAEPLSEALSEAQELIETIMAAIRQRDANFFIGITFPFM